MAIEHYYANTEAQNTGEHEVHKKDCSWMPDINHRKYLGYFDSCNEALQEAKKHYSQVDGCAHCFPECHKR